ncbi:tudor domain-containing protein 6 [Tiliqua scincoides]|uniref:tudor domain-containing protein 6 n=1 Tax=Tiliqua scincoides TaxID=71010 RepID=UPI003462314F
MCTVLPSPGSCLSLRVSFVEVHAGLLPVRLWGLPGERREEYLRLAEEIQAKVGPRLAAAPRGEGESGAVALGDLCLVELGGRWHRCRVVSRQPGPGQDYRVFLLDEGRTVSAGPYYLARGCHELFCLPSEVLGCVLADLVPAGRSGAALAAAAREPGAWASLGPGILRFGWTAGAVEFLGCLHGKEVSGLVREVLIPQRLVVLELPWLLLQMHHLGLARQISPSAFRALLHGSLASPSAASPLPEPFSSPPPAQTQLDTGALDYFYPRLELDVTEPVLVTQISDPYRVYCQLRSFSSEIKHLSDTMYQAFEAAGATDLQENLPTPGSPCAARGIDGCWYRALLLEIYPGSGPEEQPGAVAQVICVDYGRKEFVTKRNLRCLPGEYFRMPVVTYPCSLQGIADRGCGWARSQISELKTLLLGKVVQAHIEAYCPFEHLYYVTLYAEDGLNLNCLFGVQARCLAQSLLHSNQEYISDLESISAPSKKVPDSPSTLAATVSQMNHAAVLLPGVHLKAGKCYSARISFLQDPTEFWVHLQEHQQPLCYLKQNLHDFYSQSRKLESILLQPQPGSLCCVMLKENSYHRALVTKVQGKDIEVYLVDRGNTEVVDLTKVKELLPQFRDLPAVALRCALANPSSQSRLWSSDAVDYFRKAVLNKELVIQVLGMQGDIYIVELFDNSLGGEKNVGKIMSQGNYTEYVKEVKEPLKKLLDEPLRRSSEGIEQTSTRIKSTKEESSENTCHLSCKAVAEEDSCATLNPLSYPVQKHSEIRPGFSCEEQLEVGSTVDVVVSYTESPSLFWCQLDQSSQDLKALMAKIQDYCINSAQPHDWPNPVCLAKYAADGKWYRAHIVNAMSQTEEVEVTYVDYGNKELVSRKDLRATRAEFLQLRAQAFTCSLYNLIQPNGQDPFVWDEKGTEAFQEFVDAASKLELKCTKFALAALNNKDLFNIVDLITPFESVCHFLTRKGLARAVQPEKPLTSSVHLLSYYYSTHDLKIGSEEVVYVTHVHDPCLFYCQLARSADVLGLLTANIGKLSKMWHSLQASQAPGNLYLAKYTDGCWYRATVSSAKSTKEAFFVDFGNTLSLKNEDLIQIPNNAYEILLLPVQAIKCSLSDVADVPKDSAAWFEKTVLDKPLKALVVAKEPDGKLIVELYDGKIKINAKLKESLDLQHSRGAARYAEKETSVYRYPCDRETNTGPRRLFLTDVVRPAPVFKRWRSENLEMSDGSRPGAVCQEARQFEQKSKKEIVTKFSGSVERVNRNDPVADGKGRECAHLIKREGRLDNFKKRDQSEISIPSALKKISDLPQKNISPGLKTLVYVSHINNPSDFYVQLVEDEPLLDRISEKLNNSAKVGSLKGQELYIGDLMCALFSEDGLWYRAMVREKPSGELVSVQYIDYGNTAVVDSCKICRLPEDCSSFPMISVHCSLGGMKTTKLPDWPQEAVLYFQQRTSEIQINGEFGEKCKDKWEILLCDQEGSMTVELVNSYLQYKTCLEETSDEKECASSLINLCETVHSGKNGKPSQIPDSKSFLWKIPEVGQTVKTYAVVVKSPGYFWCQFADTDAIGSVERKLQEAGELARSSVGDIKSGFPCLVEYDENKLYRAIVSSVEGDMLRIIRVDYGTEELVSKEMIIQISHELLTIPPQAFLCCLFGFNATEGSWAEETNKIFCEMIVDSLLDVTVLEKQNSDLWEIPVFVVKLENKKKSINEHIKPFWIHSVEDSGPASANIHSPVRQHENAEEEDLEVVPFETAQPLADEEDLSDLGTLEMPPSSDDTKQLLLELEMLRAYSCDDLHDLRELESAKGNLPLYGCVDATVQAQSILCWRFCTEDETACSLKGFDIGSRCMVWSGVKWFKAQILGISAEGTKVLNLSSGHEEIVNPVNVWNGIPEVVSSLSKMLHNKMDTLCPMPAGDLAMEV